MLYLAYRDPEAQQVRHAVSLIHVMRLIPL